jgi:hypothetical protein
MRKVVLLMAACVVALAACSSSSGTAKPAASNGGGGATPTAGGGGGDSYWSGNGSAQVKVGGTAATVSPGGCYTSAAIGTDFRFGNWENPTSADWIIGLIYSDKSKEPVISGGIGGKLFVLGDATGTVGSDGKGTFSGTDSVGGNGTISGTFTCK